MNLLLGAGEIINVLENTREEALKDLRFSKIIWHGSFYVIDILAKAGGGGGGEERNERTNKWFIEHQPAMSNWEEGNEGSAGT